MTEAKMVVPRGTPFWAGDIIEFQSEKWVIVKVEPKQGQCRVTLTLKRLKKISKFGRSK